MNDMEGFGDEIIYIPGNHDPSTMLARDRTKLPVLSSNPAYNIHRGAFKLRDDLLILGLGGSLPGYQQIYGGPLELRYQPYPYGENMPYNYGDDLAALWNEATTTFPNAQFIMMTHDGPYGSSTAQNSYLSEGKVIHCGSKDLTNLLLKEQNRIVFN